MENEIEPLMATLEQYDALPARERLAFPYARMTVELRRQIIEREAKARDDADEAYRRRAREREVVDQLPQELLKTFDLSKHPCSEQHGEVMAWELGKMGLMLIGETGMGKSRSLLQLVARLIMDGTQVVYWSAPRLADKISAMAFTDCNELDKFIHRLETCSVLVLDDLGAHRPTERICQEFHRIIDTRYSEGRPILITTNCTPAQLQKRLLDEHGRAVRRLREITTAIHFAKSEQCASAPEARHE